MTTSLRTFYHLLANNLLATITNSFVWFMVTFWVFLETQSVLATAYVAGTFAVCNMTSALIFGTIVDHSKKKVAMIYSSIGSIIFYSIGFTLYSLHADAAFSATSPHLIILIGTLIIGSVFGNLRTIALSTAVSLLFSDNKDKANGLIGTTQGVSFAVTSLLGGLALGTIGFQYALLAAILVSGLSLFHLLTVHVNEHTPATQTKNSFNFKETWHIVRSEDGLLALIFFTTFNNFLGGVFMALLDAYGLSLVSVETWGFLLSFLSVGFIAGSTFIARYGLGKKLLRRLLIINIITWTTCIIFTIQPSITLLVCGMFIWLTLVPFIEATEHTVIQKLIPYEQQGRVFGFAQSVESSATPITAFLIGPIAQFIFIPFMTTGAGVALIGDWFGTGSSRGIALVFIIAGCIGLCTTLAAFYTRSYQTLTSKLHE